MALKQLIAGTAVVCVSFTLVGCSSSSGSKSSSTTTPKQAVCADKDKLQSSVQALPDSVTGGKSSINKALDQVKQNLTALKSSAKASLQPKVDKVQSALNRLQDVVQNISASNLSESLAKAGDASSKVVTSAKNLADSLDAQCG